MPYDEKRRLYSPDFLPPDQQGWVDMGQPDQINIAPAAGAFQSRFMGGNKGDMNNVPNPTMNDLPEMDSAMPDNAGGAPMKGKGLKSL
jgi:hypothetical protein